MRLSAKVKALLLQGVTQAGSYDPDEVLFRIEESLTGQEEKAVREFLEWVSGTNTRFGHATIHYHRRVR